MKNTNNKKIQFIIKAILIAFMFLILAANLSANEKNIKINSKKIKENSRVHFYLKRNLIKGKSDLDKIRNFLKNKNLILLKSVMTAENNVFKYYVYFVNKKNKKTNYAIIIFDYLEDTENCIDKNIKNDIGENLVPFGWTRYYH